VITMTGPRLYYAMAADGLFIQRAARLDPRHGTPAFMIRAQAAVAVGLLLTQTYDQLLSYVVFCDAMFFALTGVALFRLRRREAGRGAGGESAGAFRVPGHPWTTGLFVVANAGVVLNCFASAPRQAALGCLVLASGGVAYGLLRRRTERT
jgi:APA family basic amino acid/polyamine antiporter